MSRKKALLLGGTGAMGVYLAPELIAMGFDVTVTSRSVRGNHEPIEYVQGDALSESFLNGLFEKSTYDVVVDFMLYSTEDFSSRHKLLLSKCRHYIYLSSYRVFSDATIISEATPRLLDVSKDGAFLRTNDYSLEKARQEDILRSAKKNNWTIVRPSITYSKERFQLGTLEADTVVWRALQGRPVILPKEMLNKQTTMTWAGDVAKMIAGLAMNKDAMGEDFNVVTAEHHSWLEVACVYKENMNLKLVEVDTEDYIDALGGGHVKYQVDYDRMFNRVLDNSKVLKVTGLKQDDFVSLSDGLKIELDRFKMNPSFQQVNYEKQAKIDRLTRTVGTLAGLTEEEKKIYLKVRFPRTYRIIGMNMKTIRRKLRVRTRIKDSLRVVKRTTRIRTRIRKSIEFLSYKKEWLQYSKAEGAIITLPGYYNYGNMVQRFALQEFLRKNGHRFVSYAKDTPIIPEDTDRLKYTRDFVEKNIWRKKYDARDKFKAYIVGSDQVWRKWGFDDIFDELGYFFFDFAEDRDVKRIAYAASIGQDSLEAADYTKEFIPYAKDLISKFDHVSMRELSGVDIVKKEWGINAEHVIDPTLLLGEDDYNEIINKAPYDLKTHDSIFTYVILRSEQKDNMIQKIANATSLSENGIYLEKNKTLPPVEEWLKGIRDSELVVTDSFHGMVFSIIFKTSFIVLESGTGGSARVTTLLGKLGLIDRYITSEKIETFDINKLGVINWAEVDKRLSQLRSHSAKWLLDAVRSK